MFIFMFMFMPPPLNAGEGHPHAHVAMRGMPIPTFIGATGAGGTPPERGEAR